MLTFALALAVLTSLYFLATIGAMVQRDHPLVARLASYFSSGDAVHIHNTLTLENLKSLDDYECMGWRQTKNCSPEDNREPANDRECSESVKSGNSGYCELRHKLTGEIKHAMAMHCNSLMPSVGFSCDMFQSLLRYSVLSSDYEHDANFSFEANIQALRNTNDLLDAPVAVSHTNAPAAVSLSVLPEEASLNTSRWRSELTFERGIVYVIFDRILLSAYVGVRSLRALGCKLPIEMWYRVSETNVDHKLLKLLVAEYGVYLREISDKRATKYYTKLHAVFYSAFDSVLLLDADNFAVRDPTYLFDSLEFVDNGAMFWPDYWRPSNTVFNIHKDSFVWPLFGLDFVESFEQESGQILIDRRKHQKALNVLMYYGFSLPRVHEDMRLVWGDKDLFRFAWMKAKADFFMIPGPPGSAGTKHPDYDMFCGVTIAQHDPAGDVVFLHRNTEKLSASNDRFIWTHIQQFKRTSKVSEHTVRGANGGHFFPQFRRCFGRDDNYLQLFTVKSISAFPFEELEANLLNYTREGAAILGYTTTMGGWRPKMTKMP